MADAERVPVITRLNNQQSKYTLQLSGLGQLKSNLSSMADAVPTFTETQSTADKTAAVEKFVETYNKSIVNINNLQSYNTSTQTAGALQGNSVARASTNQVRRTTDFSEFGIEVQRNGELKINKEKLGEILNDSRSANLADKFSAFKTSVQDLTANRNPLVQNINSINSSVAEIDQQRSKVNERMNQQEERYYQQFVRMNSLINSFQSTSNYLTQFLQPRLT